MKLKPALAIAVLLTGCGSAPPVTPNVQAVHDFIAVSGFERTDQMRVDRRFNFSYVNDYFVSVSEGSRFYLIEFRTRCMNLRQQISSPSMVDHRRDASYIRASWDTIRGCPIDKIYAISQAELEEAHAIQDSRLTSRVRQ